MLEIIKSFDHGDNNFLIENEKLFALKKSIIINRYNMI